MTATNGLMRPRAPLGRPALDSKHRPSRVAEFNPARHLNGIVAEEQGDSFIDAVLESPATNIDESDVGNTFAVDPTAETQESRPAPTAEVGPGASRPWFVATSPTSPAVGLPRPIHLLNRAADELPGAGLGVLELDRQHRAVAFDPFLDEANGVGPSLEGMSAAVHGGTRRGSWEADAWRPSDVGDDRLSRRLHLTDSDDSEEHHRGPASTSFGTSGYLTRSANEMQSGRRRRPQGEIAHLTNIYVPPVNRGQPGAL